MAATETPGLSVACVGFQSVPHCTPRVQYLEVMGLCRLTENERHEGGKIINTVNEAHFEQAKHKHFLLKEECLLMR